MTRDFEGWLEDASVGGAATGVAAPPNRHVCGPAGSPAGADAGYSIIELVIVLGVMAVVMALSMQAFTSLAQVVTRDTSRSYLTSTARGSVDRVTLLLRNDFVQFNTVTGTPLGVNFDLDETSGALVRDGLLFYVDANHNAQIFPGSVAGQPQSAGLDDVDGDGRADVIGLALVRQDLDRNGVQDIIDANADGLADDVDGDGNGDPLWTLTRVRFNNISAVSTTALWRAGDVLATNAYVVRRVASGPLTGSNIRAFQYSASNSLSQVYDTAASGGNDNGLVEEPEIGNMGTADGVINTATEVASIDSIAISLPFVQVARQGGARTTLEFATIDSDRISPRLLVLIKRNGMVGLPNPALSSNIR